MAIYRDDDGYIRNENGDYWSGTAGSWMQKEEWEELRRNAHETALLTFAKWESGAERRNGREGSITFEIVAAQLNERHIAAKLVCKVCGFEWDPCAEPDNPDPAYAFFNDASAGAPRCAVLACPQCAERLNSEPVEAAA